MAELIAPGTTAANSADFTLTDGQSATLYLKTAGPAIAPASIAVIQVKSGASYFTIGQLTTGDPMQVLQAAGTFRVVRKPHTIAFGVDKD